MVIVTQNQYILASKIHHVTLDENTEHHDIRDEKGRNRTHISHNYTICVYYTPEDTSGANNNSLKSNNDIRECSVVLRGALNAYMVFKNLIQQIREQMPDQLYLDKALENMIINMDLEAIKDRDADDGKRCEATEVKSDRRPKKVRRARKAKRRSKKVLRGTKRRR